MNKITRWYDDLRFSRKILLSCLVAGLFPLLALSLFSLYQIHTLLLNREQQALSETLAQAASRMEDRMRSCEDAMTLLSWDKSLGLALNRVYYNNYEMYLVYTNLVDPLFLSLRTTNPMVQQCTIYTTANLNPHGDALRPLEDVCESPWYAAMSAHSTPTFFADPDARTLALASPVLSAGLNNAQRQNYLYMELDYAQLFTPLESLYEQDFAVEVRDEAGNLVYSWQSLPEGAALPDAVQGDRQDEFLTAQQTLAAQGWQLSLYRPMGIIYRNMQPLVTVTWLLAAGSLLLFSLLVWLLSRAVVRPLEALTRNMQAIEEGDLTVSLAGMPARADEIGILMARFSSMVERLRYLVNEVYQNKIEKQAYELKALQAQINPHFLYNSLSLINSKAIIAGQDDISQMAQLLSTFYRTTLNKGQDVITVEDEWKNVTAYIRIQLMMHRHSFDFEEELDPSLGGCRMPNLLLQPLVENAILHGIDGKKTAERGRLTLRGRREKDLLVFTIADNGCGMTEEQLRQLLLADTKGYGVQNVNRRVQLSYGSAYGLTYTSAPGEGTTARLAFPLGEFPEDPEREKSEPSSSFKETCRSPSL